MNIYVTTEPESKLSQVIVNIKNFFIFDVQQFLRDLRLNPSRPSDVYILNMELINKIRSVSKMKKFQGIIYINRNLNERLYHALKDRFGNDETIDKFILIDNGVTHKHQDLYDVFDEIFFFERFSRNRIIESNGVEKRSDAESKLARFDDEINKPNTFDLSADK